MRPLPIPLAVLLLALLLATPAAADSVQTYSLPNGLLVHFQHDPRRPRVAVAVDYRVGARDDPSGYHSLAHLVEHLMFQGSTNVHEDGFFRHLERAGSTDHSGTTTWDSTTYFERVPAARLATALWLESDRMGFMLGHLAEGTLAIQKEVVRNEWRQRGQGAVAVSPLPAMTERLYPAGHPYRKGLSNLESQMYGVPDLDAIDEDDVAWFFQRWYQPANATLAVVGDVPTDRAAEMVAKYFGPIQSAATLPERTSGGPIQLDVVRRMHVLAPVFQQQVVMVWPLGPRGRTSNDALAIVGGVFRRTLARRLIDEAMVDDISIGLFEGELDSLFVIRAIVRRGTAMATVERVIDEEIRTLQGEGIEDAVLGAAKRTRLLALLADEQALTPAAVWLSRHHEPLSAVVTRTKALETPHVEQALRQLPLGRRVIMQITQDRRAPRKGWMTVRDETP